MYRTMVFLGVVLAGVAMASAARGDSISSISELLEKGIYTEETVGDLDKAISIYAEVIERAKANHLLAARAQYKIGQCLLKQGKKADATAAFEKLISDFPNAKELVAKAKKHVPNQAELTLGKVPWKDGEFMQLSMKLGGGKRVGAMIWSVESAKSDGKDVCRTTLHRYAGMMGYGVSHVEADPSTCRPIKSVLRNSAMGNAETEYTPTEAVVTTWNAMEKKSVHKTKLDKVYYDQEQACQILRRLPLAEGYKGVLPLFIPLGSVKMNIRFEVAGKETLEVPAGKFECYKVPLPTINQTLWYSTDANRYLVQLEVPGAAIIELEQLGLNKPGEMRTCKNDELGLSFSVPAGWYFYDATTTNYFNVWEYCLLDPEEIAINSLRISKVAKDNAKQAESDDKKTAQSLAEKDVAARTKELKDYKVRADSWKEFTVGGLPAVSVICDYLAGKQKKTEYTVFVLGKENKVRLRVSSCDPDKLDGLRIDFDKIVESLKVEQP